MRFASSRRRAGIVAMLVAGAMLAGCSGGGPDEEWVRYADDLCAASEDLRGVVLTPVYPGTAGEAEAKAANRQAFRDYVEALREAQPPAELASYHQRIVDFMAMLVDTTEEDDEEARLALATSFPDDLPEELNERFEAASRESEACQRLNEARASERE